jgi:hypothetical protein
MSDKDIKRVYEKRRKLLKTGHCVRCGHKLTETRMNCKGFPELKGQLIAKGGIMKNKKCPSCETDLMEFCFKDLMEEAKAKAKAIVDKAKAKPAKKTTKKKKRTKKKTTLTQDTLF